jgi:type IV pilus assembly protein PilX
MKSPPRMRHPSRQRGVSLAIVLILLLVVTLLGLASLRGTLMEERLSSNLYDRNLSFEAAESALRDAETKLRNGGVNLGQDCTTTLCPTPDRISGVIAGCATCWTNVPTGSITAAGQPQYYIQRLAETTNVTQLGLGQSAQCQQASGCASTDIQGNYRVYARSHDPTLNPDRSVVVLESNISVTTGN